MRHQLSAADLSESEARSILDVAEGRVPAHVVNRDVLERPGFQARLAAALP